MSHHEEQRLREAMRASTALSGDGSACPEAEVLRRSARGELARPEQEEVILHLSACGACAASWRVARAMASEQARPRFRFGTLAAAAAIVVAAAGLWIVLDREPSAPPTFRNQESRWLRSQVDGATLPRERFELRWTAGPEGTLYDLRVLREDLEELHRADGLEQAVHLVPPEALREISSGTRVLWQVTAHLPDGRTAVSGTFITTVK